MFIPIKNAVENQDSFKTTDPMTQQRLVPKDIKNAEKLDVRYLFRIPQKLFPQNF